MIFNVIETHKSGCGPQDAFTPANKNRTGTPDDSTYVKIDWAELRDLPANHAEDLLANIDRKIGSVFPFLDPGSRVTVDDFLSYEPLESLQLFRRALFFS